MSISKLDLEIAEVDADRNIAEESLKRFVEDHELKVQAVKVTISLYLGFLKWFVFSRHHKDVNQCDQIWPLWQNF